MTASIVRWQLVSPDPSAATTFYHQLFGWKVSTANAMGYREVKSAGIEGGVWPAPPGTPGMVQLFVEVGDVADCLTRATGLGAKVVVPRSVLPDGDTMAVLIDPTGVSIGICSLARNAT
jgi:uncharacterized protein